MLVALELVVAVVIVRCWSGRPLSRGSWPAAVTVVAGIAIFLLVTSSGHHHATHPNYVGAASLGAIVTGGGAFVAVVAGLRASGRGRAVLLAVAAGLADACSAVVTMAFSHEASHGLAAIVASWPVYAVVVCGIGNVLLTQTAYQTGQPMVTLPIIAAVTPVASVAIGIGLLGETPQTGVVGAVVAAFAVLMTSLALARLARSAPHPEPTTQKSKPAVHAAAPAIQAPVPPVPAEAPGRLPELVGAGSQAA